MGSLNTELAREAAAAGVVRAVESGTLLGDGAIALGQIFAQVETIELSWSLALRAWVRLLRHRNIKVRLGDSRTILRSSSVPTLYWFDAHWSGARTAGAERQCPLLDELRTTSPGTFGDWYLIDDARLFTGQLDPILDPGQWPTLEEIRSLMSELRPNYEVRVREDLDLIVARPSELPRDPQ